MNTTRNMHSVTDTQYTERTRYGKVNTYRVSEPGQSFFQFMEGSPFYSPRQVHDARILQEIEFKLRTTRATPERKTDWGWSDFTATHWRARILVHVSHVERLNNSTVGGPRWRIFGEDIQTGDVTSWRTESDGSIGYDINNWTNSRNRFTYIMRPGRAVTLLVSRAGIVRFMEIDGVLINEIERRTSK